MHISTQHLAIMISQPTCSYNPETMEMTVPWFNSRFKGHKIIITKDAARLEDPEGNKVDDVSFDYSNEALIEEAHSNNTEAS